MFYITNVLCLATQPPRITRGSLWEAEGLEEEAKVCFISLIPCFSSSALPSSAIPEPPWQRCRSFEGCRDLQLPSGYPKKPEISEEREHVLVKFGIWNLNMRTEQGWRSYPLPTPPSSCDIRVRHCSKRWCPAGCVLDVGCDGAVDGWSSVPAWRLLLQ
jgi:hypothetical protein